MKIVLSFFFLMMCGVGSVVSTTATFTYLFEVVDWNTAKSRCEDRGERLAVLDTAEKRAAFQEKFLDWWKRVWIGFHDPNGDDQHVWLNGQPVPDDDPWWEDGEPDHGSDDCGMLTRDRSMADYSCSGSHVILCEKTSDSAASTVTFTRYNGGKTWESAKSHCERLGQRLAILDTEEKLTALKEQFPNHNSASFNWVGLYDLSGGNNFVWLNGNPLSNDDENWVKDQPNPRSENCGHLKLYNKWSADTNCHSNLPFICETITEK